MNEVGVFVKGKNFKDREKLSQRGVEKQNRGGNEFLEGMSINGFKYSQGKRK